MIALNIRVEYHPESPPTAMVASVAAPLREEVALGDGRILGLVMKYGPVLLKWLVTTGVIKLPPGFNLPVAEEIPTATP